MKKLLSALLILALFISMPVSAFAENGTERPLFSGAEKFAKKSPSGASEDAWLDEVAEYVKNEDYEKALKKLAPYLKKPEARALEAYLYYDQGVDYAEIYRAKFAEMIIDGLDIQALVGSVFKKIYGYEFAMDTGCLAFNAYSYGDTEAAVELLYYYAEKGHIFTKELFCFGFLHNECFLRKIADLPNKDKLRSAAQKYLCELSELEDDPVALYLTGEAVDCGMDKYLQISGSDLGAQKLYENAAVLFDKLAREGSIDVDEPGETADFSREFVDMINHQSRGSTDNPLVDYYIGYCYYLGLKPFKEDYQEAAQWFKQAADLGLPEGGYEYAYHLFIGSVDGSFSECYSYMYDAAYNGHHPNASYLLAFFETMLGNYDEADELLGFALEYNDPQATEAVEKGSFVLEEEMGDQIEKWKNE